MNTMDMLLSRRSIRSYTGEQITEDELDRILLAANAAPIGMGRYDTMHLTVIRNGALLEKIDETAAGLFGRPGIHPLYGAPLLILVSAMEPGPDAGSANVTYSNAAIVAHNMALEATELGVGVVHIWGAIRALCASPELLAELNLPEGFVPCCAVSLGKTDEKYTLREVPMARIATDYID